MQTSGHKVLITGATRGIGLAIARRFAEAGNRIVIVGSSTDSVERVLAEEPSWSGRACDLGSLESRQTLIAWIRSEHPDLTVLINNAGVQWDMEASEDAPLRLCGEVAVNAEAVVHLCTALRPVLEEQAEAAIVNVSSGLAIVPKASAPVYCATKAFVRSYSISLRYQLDGTSVRVFDLAPPLVATDMTAGRNEGALSAEGLVDFLWRAWERDQFYIPAGQTRLLEWVNRLSPSLAQKIMRNK